MNIQKMDNVRYSCTSLSGTNKKGILKPLANGYYRQPIGAIGVHNSAGFYYTVDGCRKMFEQSSSFMRRIQRGAVRGEVGHPQQKVFANGKKESFDDFAARIMRIEDTNICVQWMNVFLDINNYKDEKGMPLIVIVGDYTPSGVHGAALQKAVDNPHENVCFSVRSFTDDYMVRGVRHRDFQHIVTFDWVNEPGISIAEKYKAAGLEGYDDGARELATAVFSKEQMLRASSRETLTLGNESATLTQSEMFSIFGWKQEQPPKYLRR